MSGLEGKVIAITGAASGMGWATATLLASKGAVVSLSDVQEAKLLDLAKTLATKYSAKVMTTVVDVRSTESVDGWIESTVKAFGRLDGAVNCAGVGTRPGMAGNGFGPIVDTTDEMWEFVNDINAKGMFKCVRAECKAMLQKGDGWTGGSIVNVASIAALKGFKNATPYCASKWAVLGITKTVASEVGPEGIRVNAICPGVIETPMVTDVEEVARGFDSTVAGTPLRRRGLPEEIAKVAAYLLSDDSSYVSGVSHAVDGGYMASAAH